MAIAQLESAKCAAGCNLNATLGSPENSKQNVAVPEAKRRRRNPPFLQELSAAFAGEKVSDEFPEKQDIAKFVGSLFALIGSDDCLKPTNLPRSIWKGLNCFEDTVSPGTVDNRFGIE